MTTIKQITIEPKITDRGLAYSHMTVTFDDGSIHQHAISFGPGEFDPLHAGIALERHSFHLPTIKDQE